MHAYVINLDRAKDRWALMKKEFKNTNIKLIRFPAIESPNGAYGLVQSYINLLKLAVRENLDNILILEDDVHLTKGSEERWNKIKKWLDANPTQWDIYTGGSFKTFFPSEIAKIDDIILYTPIITICTHWTYVPKRNFKPLINYLSNMIMLTGLPILEHFFPLDALLCLYGMTISHPFVAYQKNNTSTIKGRIFSETVKKNNIKSFKLAEQDLGKTRKNSRSK